MAISRIRRRGSSLFVVAGRPGPRRDGLAKAAESPPARRPPPRSAAPPPPGEPASTSGTAPTKAAPVKADASKPAVLVGYHNLEGGAISLPEIRQGFESGLNYVNEELGGINGRPLTADYCK